MSASVRDGSESGTANASSDSEATEAARPGRAVVSLEQAQTAGRLDIARSQEKSLDLFGQITEELKPKHSYSFFEALERPNPHNTQQMKGWCMCCRALVHSTGATRFASHLTACPLAPGEIRSAFRALSNSREKKATAKRDAAALAAEEADLQAEEVEAAAGKAQTAVRENRI